MFLTPHAERSLSLLAEKGIAAFRTPEACADAFAAYFSWSSPRPGTGAGEKEIVFQGKKEVDDDPFGFIESLGIPVVQRAIAEAPDYAHSVPYPVAIKILDAEHKTEVGGVVLSVPDEKSLKEEVKRMRKARVMVQKMESGLAEAIVGYRDDPVVGPVVLVGAGGTLAEIYKDFCLAIAPVTVEEAEGMIGKVKALATIRGYRNLPRGDVKALAAAVSAFSRLCLLKSRPVREAEINPLIVKAHGIVAVDARVVLKE